MRLAALLCAAAVALPARGAEPRPVVVQGALARETDKLVERLERVEIDRVGGWTFWRGRLDGYPVIVSRTLVGVTNAAAATVLAIERYRPIAIFNQGTSGGHEPGLQLYDIVLGTSSVSLGAFRTPFRPAGAGSNPLDWMPLDLLPAEGSAGSDRPRKVMRFPGDAALLAVARGVKQKYTRGKVVEGVIGTSDVWNDELDRIARFHEQYGTAVEEMEAASAAQVAQFLNVPFLGIRIVSDNITNGARYDPKTGEACQEYVYQVVKAYVATLAR